MRWLIFILPLLVTSCSHVILNLAKPVVEHEAESLAVTAVKDVFAEVEKYETSKSKAK